MGPLNTGQPPPPRFPSLHPPGAHPPGAPAGNLLQDHKVEDIGNEVKKKGGIFSKLKGSFKDMTKEEKKYMMAAGAIYILVLLLMTVLSFVFGFGAFGIIFMGLSPLFFTASYPIARMAKLKYDRSGKVPESVKKNYEEQQKQLEQQYKLSREVHAVENLRARHARRNQAYRT